MKKKPEGPKAEGPKAEGPADPEVQKQIEAVVGKEVTGEAFRRLNFWSAVASYNFTFTDSYTTWMNLIVALPKICNSTPLLDVSGFAATGTDGKRTFRLKDFVCLDDFQYTLAPPINVIATPVSTDPVFLTVEHTFIQDATNIEIKVATWDANGTPAPNIGFDWRCRVVYMPAIL